MEIKGTNALRVATMVALGHVAAFYVVCLVLGLLVLGGAWQLSLMFSGLIAVLLASECVGMAGAVLQKRTLLLIYGIAESVLALLVTMGLVALIVLCAVGQRECEERREPNVDCLSVIGSFVFGIVLAIFSSSHVARVPAIVCCFALRKRLAAPPPSQGDSAKWVDLEEGSPKVETISTTPPSN